MSALDPKATHFLMLDGDNEPRVMVYRDVVHYAATERSQGRPMRIAQFGARNAYMFCRGDNDWVAFLTLYPKDRVTSPDDLPDGRLFDLMRS